MYNVYIICMKLVVYNLEYILQHILNRMNLEYHVDLACIAMTS
jgi:hypothetical protein